MGCQQGRKREERELSFSDKLQNYLNFHSIELQLFEKIEKKIYDNFSEIQEFSTPRGIQQPYLPCPLKHNESST